MPPIGAIHPITRERVEFSAFDEDTTRNGRPAYPPWAARFVALRLADDIRHSTLALTATRCTTCPRETFIATLFEYYTDLTRRYGMDRGSCMHQVAAASWNPSVYMSEHTHKDLMTLHGELFGQELSGVMDACRVVPVAADSEAGGDALVRPVELIDLKFPKDFSVGQRKKQRGHAKLEHAIQLNILRLLLGQQKWALDAGYNEEDVLLTVWDHAIGKAEGPEPLVAPHMSEFVILGSKPLSMDVTVREIIDMHVAARNEWEGRSHEDQLKPETKKEIAARIPLYGQTSSWKCQYCDVEPICSELVREFGMPGVE